MKALLAALLRDRDEPTMDTEFQVGWEPSQSGSQDVGETAGGYAAPPEPVVGATRAIELHPGARTNFDSKAESLLSALVSSPADADTHTGVSESGAPAPFAERLPDHTVPNSLAVFRDGEGTVVARTFIHAGMITGLQGEAYRALRRIAEDMQRTSALRRIVGVDTLEEIIFDWVRARAVGSTDMAMSALVLDQLAARQVEYEVVLPLFRVQLAEAIQVGRVTLRTITAADFSRWESAAAGANESSEVAARRRMIFLRERRRMQGLAAAVLAVRGERSRVLEAALEEAAQAVSLLRLFSPAIVSPLSRSFCTLWGYENLEHSSYLLHEPARARLVVEDRARTRQDFVWRVDAHRVHLIRQEVLDALLRALYDGAATAFRDEIFSVLVLYAESALRTTPAEKLLSILIPLESFLLRTASEPIAENIAVRLAFAIGETLEERKHIVEIMRGVYAMRSAYVHHRKSITEIDALETLREFMQHAWRFFLGLGAQVSRYRDREAYLAMLDDRKLA